MYKGHLGHLPLRIGSYPSSLPGPPAAAEAIPLLRVVRVAFQDIWKFPVQGLQLQEHCLSLELGDLYKKKFKAYSFLRTRQQKT